MTTHTAPTGYPFNNVAGYANAAAAAAKCGRAVYLNTSPVSIHRASVSLTYPTGMVTDWCAVSPNGAARRLI